ncbi:trehalose-6-phosphate hydrolase [Trichococcus patagoniensis]|uniref:Alpha,alpha-phosphotrehalase n=1 Tax=Trichococcus patagoniensis TaxID=382641 RepID=A0A2T5III1_9LACT|nr:alpha,alpha-phosphotrehalase [Trichococcus patagoniensis]PTQ83637.1 trehalose-6-phosphate hydrolase [Trichococcus patagoniensis]
MKDIQKKVIYQLYPKSFKDSDGNGIGDIQGIISKVPYLAELGIDMIWMNPIFVSPQMDNGYDITDYYAIDPVFGTMADFEELVSKLKQHGIEIMFDMVFNHTSTTHEWFQKALAGDKEYQDYYIIRDPKEDGSLPTNWGSKFGGEAWAPFGDTGKYYLHLFDVTQADLNWRNPKVRQELQKVVNFWLEKGIKGFRFDVLNLIGKDVALVDSQGSNEKSLYTDRPIVHDYIHELNQASFGTLEDIITVGEMSSTTVENGILYSNPDRNELSMIFSFHHLKVDYKDGEKWTDHPFDFLELKRILNEWQAGMSDGNGWNALFWNNHDQPRANSRFGDPQRYPFETASMLAQTIHLLRGTPYIYQGEEIGMTNPDYDDISVYRDIESHNAYRDLKLAGLTHQEAMHIIKKKSRDNSRTPMQWDNSLHAGFTTGEPWLQVAANYPEVNVEKERAEGKIFRYYQELIRIRKEHAVIADGSYEGIRLDDPEVFAYIRENEEEKVLVLNHFYAGDYTISIPEEWVNKASSFLAGNYGERQLAPSFTLKPYETIAFRITK